MLVYADEWTAIRTLTRSPINAETLHVQQYFAVYLESVVVCPMQYIAGTEYKITCGMCLCAHVFLDPKISKTLKR